LLQKKDAPFAGLWNESRSIRERGVFVFFEMNLPQGMLAEWQPAQLGASQDDLVKSKCS
jgi:hypothetical protein